jgi:protein-disulfide isomerase
MGPLDAPVIVMEFMDFECPFCAAWAARVDSLVQEFPDKVRVVLHHFPLTGIHPQAMQAAIAAECADRQGAFPAFQRIVFGQQSVLGIKPWIDFAQKRTLWTSPVTRIACRRRQIPFRALLTASGWPG